MVAGCKTSRIYLENGMIRFFCFCVRPFDLTTEPQSAQRCLIFRLPGDDGKRKASMLKYKKILVLLSNSSITEGKGFFAHRRLPMGKKKNILCVLRVSVVKNITANT
jgi:hypothetical protein